MKTKKLLARRGAIALACSALVHPAAHADISGFVPDAQSFPFSCSGPGTWCQPGLGKLDVIRTVWLSGCKTWDSAAPGRCADTGLDTGSGGAVQAYGKDPALLMDKALAARKAYQESVGIAYQTSKTSRYANCVDSGSNGSLLRVCQAYGYARVGAGTTSSPYSWSPTEKLIDTLEARFTVSQVGAGQLCSGYVPNVGCPTTSSSRATPPVVGMCPVASTPAVSPQYGNAVVGDPISLVTGAVVESRQDLAWPIAFSRSYASTRPMAYSMGSWRHSHESRLDIAQGGPWGARFDAGLSFSLEDGTEVIFSRTSSSAAFASAFADGKTSTVSANSEGYLLLLPTGETRQYNSSGLMTRRSARSGYRLDYVYDGAGRLASITDSYARGLTFAYVGSSSLIARISTVGGASADQVDYAYAAGQLAGASFNAGSAESYAYDEAGRLSTITDELGAVAAQFAYDPVSGKGIQSKRFSAPGSPTEQVDVAYGSSSATVTQGGAASVYTLAKDASNLTGRVSSATIADGASSYAVSYDSNGGAVGLRVGTMTGTYVSSSSTQLPSQLTKPGGAVESYTWDPATRLLSKIVGASPQGTRTTSFEYDGFGNLAGATITPGAGAARAWHWTYGTLGKMATATGPDGVVAATYEYYPDDDFGSLARRGQLKSATNALGHKSAIDEYDERGRAIRITDPNGVSTVLDYDDKGQLLSESRAGSSRTMSYDAAGLLRTVSSSSGYSATMAYDGAQRLISVEDNNGDSAEIAYDEHGNAQRTSVSQNGALVQAFNAAHTPLGQVGKAWSATEAEASSATYDANGRPKTSTDGLGRTSTFGYAATGGMSSAAEPSGSSAMTRDVDDNIKTFSAGGVSQTTYAWNDFGEILSIASPDSGAQNFARDAAARTTTMTDAAGIAHVATKDVLGRISTVSHALAGSATMTEAYAYDAGRIGMLSSVSDSSGTQAWTWNEFDMPANKEQTVGGVALSLHYGYDASGQLSSITYPSGMVVSYARTRGRVTSVAVDGALLISNIGYRPFSGEPSSWTWAGGGAYAKTFDGDGKVTGVSDPALTQETVFDAAGRLSTLAGPGFSLAASYTAGDQLSGVNVGGLTQTFGFNAGLDRTTKKTFANVSVATPITSGTHLPSSIADAGPPAINASFAYDARKNMAFNGRASLTYDLRGNLATASAGGVASSYAYNAFNQRVRKTVGGATTLFAYDEAGNLAGEYSAGGDKIAEHIYLGALPIGVAFAGSPAVHAVHTDYLGTPRVVTSGAAVAWRWDSSDPFGANLPSVQAVVYNPRFPGQYYDAETGLHYNHHRTYDPTLGRYIQPDPLGLAAGKNPFNYANQNPLNGIDPDGLNSISDTKRLFDWEHLVRLETRRIDYPGIPNKMPFTKYSLPIRGTDKRVTFGVFDQKRADMPIDPNKYNYQQNCHGTTLLAGLAWLDNDQVGIVLEAKFKQIQRSELKEGDVVAYQNKSRSFNEKLDNLFSSIKGNPPLYDHTVSVVGFEKNGEPLVFGKGGIQPFAKEYQMDPSSKNPAWRYPSSMTFWRENK